MNAVQVLRALGPFDAANLRRDPMLGWMLVTPVAIALLFRWGAGLADEWLFDQGVNLIEYYPLIASSLVVMTPMLFGVVVGFLLLDQKDDQTLTALRVTPLTAGGYLGYRIAIPVVLSVVAAPFVLTISGFADISLGKQILAGVAAAPFAPAFALFLAAVANNKVQGFALMKAAGVITWPPLIAWFVTSDWQLVFGLFPTYWPFKYYWALEAGTSWAWVYGGVGFLYLTAIVFLLQRRFDRVVAR